MNISIEKCTDLAHEVGGTIGDCILELVSEIQDLREQVANKRYCYPKLIGSSEVAELLGIDRRNLHHKRKTKGFPEPIMELKSGPLWNEETIRAYRDESDDLRRKVDS
ncbi:hypothetical protein SAMN05428962_3178 [Paenibacillus sp. BC26]|nr:hypothetical protein SAMN05428962_3178 [Paenibacillus sp. BC26]